MPLWLAGSATNYQGGVAKTSLESFELKCSKPILNTVQSDFHNKDSGFYLLVLT